MNQLNDIKAWYNEGKVFAYPTEAVFGLGCDPQNKQAVYKILELKRRDVERGLILIASEFTQIAPYVLFDSLPLSARKTILASWPGPVTWLLPKSLNTPHWISGSSNMVAVRISAHQQVRAICNYIDKPMVSTSANPAGQAPALNETQVKAYFGEELPIVKGALGNSKSPSKIFHSLTMEMTRA